MLRRRLSTAATDMVQEAETAQRTLDQVITEPFKERASAAAHVRNAKPIVESARRILKGAGALRDALGIANLSNELVPIGFRISELDDQIRSISLATERLDVVSLMLQEPNPINIEQWEGQYVNLYYFDDIPRLLNVLVGDDPINGAKKMGGDVTARSTANAQGLELVHKIEDLAQKRAELSNARAAYEKRRIDLRQTLSDKQKQLGDATTAYNHEEINSTHADDALRSLDLRLALDTKERDRIGGLRAVAVTNRDDAKSALDSDLTNKNKQLAYSRSLQHYASLDSQYNNLDRKMTVDHTAVDKANADKTSAESKRDTAKAKKEQLEADIKTAQGTLEESTGELKTLQTAIDTQNGAVSAAMRDMYVQSLAENAAFANARDNQSFWRTQPPTELVKVENTDPVRQANLTDPVRRVFLFGFPDSKTIFIRGRASDVKQVREIIASFDRPQAQALMTLWSIELSSQSTPEGSNIVSKQIRVIENELRISRAQTDASLTLLREAINKAVNDSLNQPCSCLKCKLLHHVTGVLSPGMNAAVSFYDLDVFQELHLLDSSDNLNQPESILGALLPDPRGTTTLAEALVVLSLAKSCHRQSVIEYFKSHIMGALTVATVNALGQDIRCPKHSADLDWVTGTTSASSNAPYPVHNPHPECAICTRVHARLVRRMPRLPGFGALMRYCGDTGDGAWLHSFRQEVITQLLSSGGREIRLAAGRTMQRLAQQTIQISKIEKNAVAASWDDDADEAKVQKDRRVRNIRERDKDLMEGGKVLDWAKTRPTPAELHDNFQEADKRFIISLGHAESGTPVQTEAANAESAKRDIDLQVAQRKLSFTIKQLQGSMSSLKGVDITRSSIKELRDLGDINGLARALTDKDKAEALSQIATTRANEITNKTLYKVLVQAPTTQAQAAAAVPPEQKIEQRNKTSDYVIAEKNYDITKRRYRGYVSEQETWAQEQYDAIRNFRSGSQLDFDNAREAAANETIKRALKAVDEDIQQMFIDPMLDRVRIDISVEGVSVGVFQRTQVIASNRLVAKVDPAASSTLNLAGQETNALQEVLQLAQLVAQVQTGGLLTALGGFQKNTAQEKATPPAFYGITSGNTFRMTPVLDPTGQALRFRFDHVLRTAVREPNGTVNPQLNRIEQTGVNTEVQLSNHEIGVISRFQTNQKLGQPTEKSGGIPILKHIPFLNEIPLIGWFSRRNARAAVVQQSLLLGQTAIFPTIGDVIHLLTKPISN